MNIKVDKQFEKDLRKVNLKVQSIGKLFNYMVCLSNNEVLPVEAKDHALKGEFHHFREFHLGGDLLVIYKIVDNSINLVRLGSHAQLFKKM